MATLVGKPSPDVVSRYAIRSVQGNDSTVVCLSVGAGKAIEVYENLRQIWTAGLHIG